MDIIEEILDKYFDEEHEYYHRYREDEENYYDVVDELKQELTKKNISFKLDVQTHLILLVMSVLFYQSLILNQIIIGVLSNWKQFY